MRKRHDDADDNLVPVDRPDLDEFLSALNGFLEKQSTPQDPGFLRFLEIFCRSVGSSEGHLLRADSSGQLESVLSYGVSPKFSEDFNQEKKLNDEPSPLDESFLQEKVVALVELKKGPSVPDWFLKIMKKYQFQSLVAVPLLGQNKPVGILCAYYHDFCLFDQGTLDRLMGIGRMVGAATEKSQVAGRVEQHNAHDKALDFFLAGLTEKAFGKLEVFLHLKKAIVKNITGISLLSGSVRMSNGSLTLTVVEGEQIPASLISRRLVLPSIVQKKCLSGEWPKKPSVVESSEWGDLQKLFNEKKPRILCESIVWQSKLLGAILVWRLEGEDFGEDDEVLLRRLAAVSALALNCE